VVKPSRVFVDLTASPAAALEPRSCFTTDIE